MGVKFNGIDLETDYGFILEDVDGLGAPRIRRNTISIPGVHGSIDFGGTYEERDIFLNGHIRYDGTHSQFLVLLSQFFSVISALPSKVKEAPLFGQPLSQTSLLSSLQLPDYFTAVGTTHQVIYNGVFDLDFIGPRQLSTAARVRIGFRQPKPWSTPIVNAGFSGDTSINDGYFSGDNPDSLHVPPVITFKATGFSVLSFSLDNFGVDQFNTKNIIGSMGGTPLFKSLFDVPNSVNGGVDFGLGTDFINLPISNATLSQDAGTIELLYFPTNSFGVVSAVLWNLYIDATHYWRCWYDHTVNRFKFQGVSGATNVTADSGFGISGSGALHKITCSWRSGIASIAVNENTRVVTSGFPTITYPGTLRIGSFGDNTLPAAGMIDELVVWNRDVGQEYTTQSYLSRFQIPFGRPVHGVLMYAGFDFSPNAVGCGDKVIGYTATLDVNDVLLVDMEKRTAVVYDISAGSSANAIANITGQFWEIYPGTNTFVVTKAGSGTIRTAIQFVPRRLM